MVPRALNVNGVKIEMINGAKRLAYAVLPAMLLGAALPLSAQAQQYPNQDIHFICAFPPGSGADVLVRYFAEQVRPLTGKNIIIENKSAGGTIAMEYGPKQKPDASTISIHARRAITAAMRR